MVTICRNFSLNRQRSMGIGSVCRGKPLFTNPSQLRLGDALAEAQKGDGEEDRADGDDGQEMLPDRRDARAAVEDGLGQGHEMGGGRQLHDGLNDGRHALARGDAAGENLQGQQHQDHQKAQLGHGARHGTEKNAHGGRGEKMQGGGQEKQPGGAGDRHAQHLLHHQPEGKAGSHEHHQPVGPHLGEHDFQRGEGHHQKVFDGAVLAFADQGRAGQDDRKHGDVVDDLHDAAEPGAGQVGVEFHADGLADGRPGIAGGLEEIGDFGVDDAADVTRADKGLGHARCIDVHQEVGSLAGQQVVFEPGRDIQDEGVVPRIHAGIHRRPWDTDRGLEVGRVEGVDDPFRELGAILVQNGDGRLVQLQRGGRGNGVNAPGKGPDDEEEKHLVVPEAAQLLDAEEEDVGQFVHAQRSCGLSARALATVKTGMKSARVASWAERSPNPRALVKTPRLTTRK
ncbi:hypothetical protein DESC_480025 [Desulfosarcina cetonica]|nr:hypothetical protein DESC_480025 [Desulfosarcina cetonica]